MTSLASSRRSHLPSTSGLNTSCLTVDIRHGSRGQIEIELESPSGMTSLMAPVRSPDRHDNYRNWRFMSVRHWGESAAGTWRVRVSRPASPGGRHLEGPESGAVRNHAALGQIQPLFAGVGNLPRGRVEPPTHAFRRRPPVQ
jgi:hypothetical protein